jgi:hypothetical protein
MEEAIRNDRPSTVWPSQNNEQERERKADKARANVWDAKNGDRAATICAKHLGLGLRRSNFDFSLSLIVYLLSLYIRISFFLSL